MADDEATNDHGIEIDSIDSLRREAERQTDLSTSDIVTLFPHNMNDDTLEGWAYLADDDKLGELPLDDIEDPRYVSYWLWETDDPEVAIRLSNFGPASEDYPLEVAKSFANPLEWTHQDPTKPRKDHCYACDTDLYYGEVPGRNEGETKDAWVRADDGRIDEEVALASDPGAIPYYVGETNDDRTNPVLCYSCRDHMVDGGTFVTVAYDGEVDQAKASGEYINDSYYRELQTEALLRNEFEDLLKSYARVNDDVTGPHARTDEGIDHDRIEEYIRVKGIPGPLSEAIVRGEVVPPFPVMFTSQVPQIEESRQARQRQAAWIPVTSQAQMQDAIDEAEGHDYDYTTGYGDEPPESIWTERHA